MTTAGRAVGTSSAQARLTARVARLYHVWGRRQKEIAAQLSVSQTTVSRMLAAAGASDVVRQVVAVPEHYHPALEDGLESRFGLTAAHVVECHADEDVPRVLGHEAARYLVGAPVSGEVVGVTSWSTTIREMVEALGGERAGRAERVVELLGDLGSPALQHEATWTTQRFARSFGAEAVFVRAPGVYASAALRELAEQAPHTRRALDLHDRLDVAFVGTGPVDVHSFLSPDDNYFGREQLAGARAAGAVGQLDQRLLDADGSPVVTALDDLVLSVRLEQLRRCPRRIVVAGGLPKVAALRAALRGGWIHELFTDHRVARALLDGD